MQSNERDRYLKEFNLHYFPSCINNNESISLSVGLWQQFSFFVDW